MSELGREEFNAAVAEAVGAVRGLYQESTLLLKEIGEQLAELEDTLSGATPARPRVKEKHGEFLPTWMGRLYWPAESADAQDDDAGEEAEEGTADKPGRDVTLTTVPVAFAKLVLHQPHADAFEPHLLYGVLSEPRTSEKELTDDESFTIGSMKVRKILVEVSEDCGATLATKAGVKAQKGSGRKRKGQGWLTFAVPEPPRRKALHEIAGPEDARRIAVELREMWSKAAS